jgi:hypothetical protein
MYVPFGSTETVTLEAPCGADTVFFVDLEKDVDLDLINQPMVEDSVEGNIKENVFLFAKNELIDSFYMERLSVEEEGHYLCFDTRLKKINMLVDGRGMELTHTENRFNCGPITIELTFDDETIPDDIFQSPQEKDDFTEDSEETMDNMELTRIMRVEDGKTKVNVILRPEPGVDMSGLSYIEWIDKACIESLEEAGIEYTGPLPTRTVDDPVIMWHFDEVGGQEEISYTLENAELAERCRELIQAVASASEVTTPQDDSTVLQNIVDELGGDPNQQDDQTGTGGADDNVAPGDDVNVIPNPDGSDVNPPPPDVTGQR